MRLCQIFPKLTRALRGLGGKRLATSSRLDCVRRREYSAKVFLDSLEQRVMLTTITQQLFLHGIAQVSNDATQNYSDLETDVAGISHSDSVSASGGTASYAGSVGGGAGTASASAEVEIDGFPGQGSTNGYDSVNFKADISGTFQFTFNLSTSAQPPNGFGNVGGSVELYINGGPVNTYGPGSHSFSLFVGNNYGVVCSASAFVAGVDGSYMSSATMEWQLITNRSTTTTLTSNANPSLSAQPVSLTATVAPEVSSSTTPSGSVDFYDASSNTDLGSAPLSSGIASLTTSTLALGSHSITATYSGDGNYNASTSAVLNQQVRPALLVTTLADSGPGSLRDVITQVNSDPVSAGPDQITFSSGIAGGTIYLQSPLPALTRNQVSITGPITISGTPPGLSQPGDGLDILANNDTVQQVAFDYFNGDGISIYGTNNTVSGDTLAYNKGNGVTVLSGTGNGIHQDLIYGNRGLPIELGTNGLVPNAPGGSHTGPNDLQNYPIITDNAGIVQGFINSAANTTYVIETYEIWQQLDTTGLVVSQGAIPLGAPQTIKTDANGNCTWSFPLPSNYKDQPTNFNAVITGTATDPNGNTSAFGLALTPAQIRTAYGLNALPFNASGRPVYDGAGQTIAIVILLNDPNIYGDVDTYDQQFGLTGTGPSLYAQYLPASSFLTVFDQNAMNPIDVHTTAIRTDVSGIWESEAALDVEWAHAIAPGAKIDLIECDYYANPKDNGVAIVSSGAANAAKNLGASVVSINFQNANGNQTDELKNEVTDYDPSFIASGVTFLAATGDFGIPGSYPAFSPDVIAVGASTLTLNADGTYSKEQGWSSSGGGKSQFETVPFYQTSVQGSDQRTIPDVAFVGGTSVAIANSYLTNPANTFAGDPGWGTGGGTSLSTPCWAGIVAIANQGRAALPQPRPALDSTNPTETLAALYSLRGDFNNIQGTGYDYVTGLGTPICKTLVPDLINYAGVLPGHITQNVPTGSVLLATFPSSSPSLIPGSLSASVTWGDGTSDSSIGTNSPISIVATSANIEVLGSHTFVHSGVFGVEVTLTAAGTTSTALATAEVAADPSSGVFAQYVVTVSGASTVQAGKGFLLSVQATDMSGNPVAEYSGPSTVVLSIDPPSISSSFPETVSLNSQGLGLMIGDIQQAGAYTITASYDAFSGTSAPVMVIPGPPAKLAFVSQPVSTPTGVPLPLVTVQIVDAFGNLITGDNTDTVKLGIASGPGSFTSGSTISVNAHGGVATFTNLTLIKPGRYTFSEVVPTLYTGPNSVSFNVAPLQVIPGSLSTSPSGFSLEFNAPFLVNSVTPVLYGPGFGVTAPVPSVTLSGPFGPVEGSLALDTATNTLTFVETDTASNVYYGSPILFDGTYTVDVLSSGATGFQALNSGGGFLDGLGNGTPGSGDYTTTFTVGAAGLGDDVVWVPDTADGPGQALSAPGNDQAGGGYPVYLDDGTGAVTSVQATLNYNSALLAITGVTGFGFSLLSTSTAGHAMLQYIGPALPPGTQTPIGFITASVPSGTASNPAAYKAKDLLTLSGIAINGGAISAIAGNALHLVEYVGDADGSGGYGSNDAVLITRVALETDSGFAAYPLTDPVIVADTDGSGFIPADAALQINEAGIGFPTATLAMPPVPSGVHFQAIANNVDPTVSLPNNLEVGAGGRLTVPVYIDDPHPTGSMGLTEAHLALTYDPAELSVSAVGIHLGSLLSAGAGWMLHPTINPITGQIAIALWSDTPLSTSTAGSLITIDFHAVGSSAAATSVDLVASVNPSGNQVVTTELEDPVGTYTLTPTPTNGFNPRIDAAILVTAAGSERTQLATLSVPVALPVQSIADTETIPFAIAGIVLPLARPSINGTDDQDLTANLTAPTDVKMLAAVERQRTAVIASFGSALPMAAPFVGFPSQLANVPQFLLWPDTFKSALLGATKLAPFLLDGLLNANWDDVFFDAPWLRIDDVDPYFADCRRASTHQSDVTFVFSQLSDLDQYFSQLGKDQFC